MKSIALLTTAVLVAQVQFCHAQKLSEPTGLSATPGAAPSVEPAPATQKTTRRSASASAANTGGFFSTGSRGDSIPPVMIRFSTPDTKSGATLEEDLFVMARVISRTLERAQANSVDYRLNVPLLLTGSGRSVRPLYIEGLGPLFMIKVSFALAPPPKVEDRAATAPTPDSEWKEAQREALGDAELVVTEEPTSRNSSYNEERVELLKKELITSLKNAANIRGLRPDEFVNIAVFGHATPLRLKSAGTGIDSATGLPARALTIDANAIASASKGSVLTLRARKSDIDAFSNGKLDADAFKSKVTATAYFGSGTGITSINSWIQEGSNAYLRQ